MPTDTQADEIHLRVPTRPPVAAVVTVAVRVLGSRAGLVEPQIDAARQQAGDAYAELVDGGDPGPVDVRIAVEPGRLQVELAGATGTRAITASR